MRIASVVVTLRLEGHPDSRARRRDLERIMEKLREHLNLSILDVEPDSRSGPARLAFVALGRSRREAEETIRRALEALEVHPHAEVLARTRLRVRFF